MNQKGRGEVRRSPDHELRSVAAGEADKASNLFRVSLVRMFEMMLACILSSVQLAGSLVGGEGR